MIGSDDDPRDVRTLLGMNTLPAVVLLVFYCAGITAPAVIALGATHSHLWQSIIAVTVLCTAAAALLAVRGDPLPLPTTFALTAVGPMMCALVVLTPPPIAYVHENWPANVYTAVLTFVCVRGRTWYAWVSMAGMFVILMVWTTRMGQGPWPGFLGSLINLGPLLMSTWFAGTIRPAAARIFQFQGKREEETRLQQSLIRREADREERLHQLAEIAYPLLRRIAEGQRLTPDEVSQCGTLETQLAASLRGSGLVHPLVNPSADAARTRGILVKMFDEGRLDSVDDAVRDRLMTGIAAELDRLDNGTIIIRIAPPNNGPVLATVRAASETAVRRVRFGLTGEPSVATTRAPAPSA
ncbi:hypothetical protein [Nocardia sp. NPDC020380]|uniref:hypothetical protein n=1 Tax=Nocardia sp. NPDC020380 TaxID=3364309 RepID=UPI003787E0FC